MPICVKKTSGGWPGGRGSWAFVGLRGWGKQALECQSFQRAVVPFLVLATLYCFLSGARCALGSTYVSSPRACPVGDAGVSCKVLVSVGVSRGRGEGSGRLHIHIGSLGSRLRLVIVAQCLAPTGGDDRFFRWPAPGRTRKVASLGRTRKVHTYIHT